MKKMLSVLLAAMLVLLAIPAVAEGNQVLTVVTWDAFTTMRSVQEPFLHEPFQNGLAW